MYTTFVFIYKKKFSINPLSYKTASKSSLDIYSTYYFPVIEIKLKELKSTPKYVPGLDCLFHKGIPKGPNLKVDCSATLKCFRFIVKDSVRKFHNLHHVNVLSVFFLYT